MGTTPKPGDSDQHRLVSKNGREHIQDREIKLLADMAQAHHEEFMAFTKQDLGSHTELDKSIRKVESDLGKYTFAGKVVWGIAGLVYTALVGGVGWLHRGSGRQHGRYPGHSGQARGHAGAGHGATQRPNGHPARHSRLEAIGAGASDQ